MALPCNLGSALAQLPVHLDVVHTAGLLRQEQGHHRLVSHRLALHLSRVAIIVQLGYKTHAVNNGRDKMQFWRSKVLFFFATEVTYSYERSSIAH